MIKRFVPDVIRYTYQSFHVISFLKLLFIFLLRQTTCKSLIRIKHLFHSRVTVYIEHLSLQLLLTANE